jgi:alkylhydroperoxidase family enzyme
MHDPLNGELGRLVALAPPEHGRINTLVRQMCAETLSLPPLPTEVATEVAVDGAVDEAESVAVEFAEQFSVDVSSVGDDLRSRFTSTLGRAAFPTVVLIYIADFLPRVRAGLEALALPVPWSDTVAWDHDTDLADVLFNRFLPGVARLRALDPLTTEVVRLRGATQHNCRMCKSRRECHALDAGGTESLYEQIELFENSADLSDRHKAALRYVDALIWSPAAIKPDVAAGVREHFTDAEAYELTADVIRNAANKIQVSLGADAPRVQSGTELFVIDETGQTVDS